MKNKFTLGLVATALALGAYMVFVESKSEAPRDTKEVSVWNLSENQAKDLKAIAISADSAQVQFVRDGDKWRLSTEPKRDLDSATWEPAYNNIKAFFATRKVEEHGKELAKYGLDKPMSTLRWGDEKSPYAIQVGEKSPTGDAYYVYVKKDDAVYTVPSFKVDEWRNLAIKPPLAPLPSPSPSPSPSVSPSPAASPSGAPAGAKPSAPAASPGPSASPMKK